MPVSAAATEPLHYDPLEPETLRNPYPLYAAMRAEAPVMWHEQTQSWVLTRHDDCQAVLRDHVVFARDRRRLGVEVPEFRQNLQSLDPPALSGLRRHLLGTLHGADWAALGDDMSAQFSATLDRAADRGAQLEWMADVAAPVSLRATADLLGVPEPDLAVYMEISDGIAARMDAGLVPANIERGDQARQDLNRLADGWLAEPSEGSLLSTLVTTASVHGVPEHYVRNTAGVLFNASFGTLYATLGNVLNTMIQLGLQAADIDEDQLDASVEELIRLDGPAQGTSRLAAEDVVLRGVPIARGDIVLTLLAAANRDPEVFEQPDEFVPTRENNPHLGFGWGPHSCVGSRFGHLAVARMLCSLRPFELGLAGAVTRRGTATVRTIAQLPVSVNMTHGKGVR